MRRIILFITLFLFALVIPVFGKNLIFINCSNIPVGSQIFDNYTDIANFALVSNRTSNTRPDLASVMASMNADVRIRGSRFPSTTPWNSFRLNGFMADEIVTGNITAEEFFDYPEDINGIILPDLQVIDKINQSSSYTVESGKFTAALRKSELGKIDVSIYGNSDTYDTKYRPMTLLLLGHDELRGDISNNCLTFDKNITGGFRTNQEYILKKIAPQKDVNQFIIIDFGDGERLGSLRPTGYEEAMLNDNLHKFLSGVIDKFNGTDTEIVFVSLRLRSGGLKRGIQMSPLMLIDLQYNYRAKTLHFLTSPSTRQDGYIVNLDIPVYILSYFDAPTDGFLGKSILKGSTTNIDGDPKEKLDSLRKQHRKMIALNNTRPKIMTGFVVAVLLVSLFTIFAIFFRTSVVSLSVLNVLLYSFLVMPLLLFISAGLGFYTPLRATFFCVICGLVSGFLLSKMKNVKWAIFIVCAVTALVIFVDTILGYHIASFALLSYDIISGSRFYGLGNEMSGVFVGTMLLSVYIVLDIKQKITPLTTVVIVIIFLLSLFMVGDPAFGTDFGGIITIACAGGVGIYLLKDTKEWRRISLLAFAVVIILIFVMVYVNMLSGSTHIGSTFTNALSDPSILWQSAIRKWGMNFRLMRFSTWTYLIVSSVIIVLLLFFRTENAGVKDIFRKHYYIKVGFITITVGAFVGFFVNDSGVVMAATTLLYFAVPIAILVADRFRKLIISGEYNA